MRSVFARSWSSRLVVAAAIAATMLTAAPLHAQRTFTTFTVFGDSFSDTGNLFQLTGGLLPLSPPYFPGRVSNGLVWTDYMAQRLGVPGDAAPALLALGNSGNYAVAGAATSGSLAPSTELQLAAWLTRPTGPAADPTGLYTYFAGANDMVAASLLPNEATRNAATVSAAMRVSAGAAALASVGARFILLPYSADLGNTPEAQGIPGRAAILSDLSALFNATIESQLFGLRSTFAGTRFFDLRLDVLGENVLLDAARGGSRYGITNATVPCLAPGAPSCDVSLYVDGLHPTTLAHAYVAEAAYNLAAFDRNVAVPEPATWSLALVAVSLLVAHRRRKTV